MLSTGSSDSLSAADHDLLEEFLDGDQAQNQEPTGSGEILGILKQQKDDLEKDLADMIKQEEAAIKEFDPLVASKEKEIAMATKAIEEKTARAGEVAVEIVNLKEDLEDTSASLAEDKKLITDLKKSCDE